MSPRQLVDGAAVLIRDADLQVALKHDLAAVGRPYRGHPISQRQLSDVPAGRIHDADVQITIKRHQGAVG